MTAPLSPTELEVVDEALAELQAQDPPTDRGPLGCVLALPAFLLLLVVPVLGRSYGLPSSVATPLVVVGIVLLVLGLTLWFTAGGFVRGHYRAAAEAATRTLESMEPGDLEDEDARVEALRACTLLLKNAYASHGPTTTETYDPAEVRNRIGDLMPLVETVERYLHGKQVIYRVFTASEDSELGSGGEAEGAGGEDPPPSPDTQ